jgi:Skp family chaperone for outer membrane proteins
MRRLIFAAFILLTTTTFQVNAQTRPQTSSPRPTPTPAPRPTATPSPRPSATPAAINAPVPESRIALIDTAMFGDEKNGIFRYVDAAKSVRAEFKARTDELQAMQTRLNTLANEIQTLAKAAVPDQKTIQAKQTQGENLQLEWNTKKERLDEDLTKRYEQVVAPISKQIGLAIDQFARQRGVTMTLDLSKLLPAILTAVPAVDLTQAFIADFNSKNPRTGPPTRP